VIAQFQNITKGSRAALVVVVVGAICLLFGPSVPVLGKWPDAMTLPMTHWVDVGLGGFLNAIKPAMRWVSWFLEFGMVGANWFLNTTPWVLVIGVTTALGWYLGGWSMAALGLGGLSFVLASGYWVESMNTLALVFVSVPLALTLGLGIGILAYEVPRVKSVVQAGLDLMQTVPTFAYLTPLLLLFGFGPVVGLIASAIYAAPPMARNVLLGLERVEEEIKEAAVMSGGTRLQQLFLVELPSAMTQIMVGVNQSLMAALSMVIIAAVIGGFNDIGWEVLLKMRKAQFGQSLLPGLVIVVFAVIIDAMSKALATERRRYDVRVFWGLVGVSVVAAIYMGGVLPHARDVALFDGIAGSVDTSVGDFTRNHGAALDGVKNGAMF
jgi:glycine betaine/proline transport system permease protein